MIRPFRPADVEGIVEVWSEATRVAHAFLKDEFIVREERAIREEYLREADTWVWDGSGRIDGFISLLGNEIGGLFVRPSIHRCGVGTALIEHALTLQESLEVEVFARNDIGRAFYRRRGFGLLREAFDTRANQPILRLRYAGVPKGDVDEGGN